MEKNINIVVNKLKYFENCIDKNVPIKVNPYGQENLEKLTDDFFYNIMKYPCAAVRILIETIHYNIHHPENHNIFLDNINDRFVYILKLDRWERVVKENFIVDLVDEEVKRMDKFFLDKIKDNSGHKHLEDKYYIFKEKSESHDEKFVYFMYNDIITVLHKNKINIDSRVLPRAQENEKASTLLSLLNSIKTTGNTNVTYNSN